MAVLKYKTGRKQLIPERMALPIWQVLYGYRQPDNEQQRQFVRTVDDVSLSWKSAPDEYIKENLEEIIPQIIATWRVDRNGHPTRPDYGPDLRFAEKWGLWARGKPTKLAEDAIAVTTRPKHYRQLSFVR
jgi:hypothetical protein